MAPGGQEECPRGRGVRVSHFACARVVHNSSEGPAEPRAAPFTLPTLALGTPKRGVRIDEDRGVGGRSEGKDKGWEVGKEGLEEEHSGVELRAFEEVK